MDNCELYEDVERKCEGILIRINYLYLLVIMVRRTPKHIHTNLAAYQHIQIIAIITLKIIIQ